jgi:hypothetical protein
MWDLSRALTLTLSMWLAAASWLPTQSTSVLALWHHESPQRLDSYVSAHQTFTPAIDKLVVSYGYDCDGKSFEGHRLSIGFDEMEFRDYDQDIGRQVAEARQDRRPVTVYVDAHAPQNAVLDRRLPAIWTLMCFAFARLSAAGIGLSILGIGLGTPRFILLFIAFEMVGLACLIVKPVFVEPDHMHGHLGDYFLLPLIALGCVLFATGTAWLGIARRHPRRRSPEMQRGLEALQAAATRAVDEQE